MNYPEALATAVPVSELPTFYRIYLVEFRSLNEHNLVGNQNSYNTVSQTIHIHSFFILILQNLEFYITTPGLLLLLSIFI